MEQVEGWQERSSKYIPKGVYITGVGTSGASVGTDVATNRAVKRPPRQCQATEDKF